MVFTKRENDTGRLFHIYCKKTPAFLYQLRVLQYKFPIFQTNIYIFHCKEE